MKKLYIGIDAHKDSNVVALAPNLGASPARGSVDGVPRLSANRGDGDHQRDRRLHAVQAPETVDGLSRAHPLGRLVGRAAQARVDHQVRQRPRALDARRIRRALSQTPESQQGAFGPARGAFKRGEGGQLARSKSTQ